MNKYKLLIIICFFLVTLCLPRVTATVKNLNLLGKVIILDAGHGGKDEGASSGPIKESKLNLILTKKLEKEFKENGLNYSFVQDNQSRSFKGVLRGLHFQKTFPQAKLVRVIEGEVYDVAVDLRKNSSTYGKYYGVILSSENQKMFMIPRGFAHGFLVLSDFATFTYKCDEFYHPEDEGGLMYNDEDVNIAWPKIDKEITLSEKDKKHPKLKDLKVEF